MMRFLTHKKLSNLRNPFLKTKKKTHCYIKTAKFFYCRLIYLSELLDVFFENWFEKVKNVGVFCIGFDIVFLCHIPNRESGRLDLEKKFLYCLEI